jgi:hypothetical protein
MKLSKLALLPTLFLSLTFAGCSEAGRTEPSNDATLTTPATSPNQPGEQRRIITATYPKTYETALELKQDASVVLRGRVADIAKTFVDRIEGGRLDGEIPFTDFTFTVDEVLAGALKSEAVVVRQTGGVNSRGNYELLDDPLMKVGETYVLFLRYDEATKVHVVLGGPQGRFVSDGMTVSALSIAFPGRQHLHDTGITLMPLDEMRRLLR